MKSLDDHVVDDPYESAFGVLSDQIITCNHIGLTHAENMVLCKKNGDFASGHKRIGKNGKTLFVLLSCAIFNQYFIAHQKAGLIHQLYSEMVESLF